MGRENQPTEDSATRTISTTDEQQAPPRAPAGNDENESKPEGTPDIMSRLPKSRPHRPSERRRATRPAKTSAPPAAQAGTSRAPRAGAKTAASQPKRQAAGSRARTIPAPATQEREQPTRSLPRLAMDGATEAAKLPIKVSGRLTLRALDAVARGLRGRS